MNTKSGNPVSEISADRLAPSLLRLASLVSSVSGRTDASLDCSIMSGMPGIAARSDLVLMLPDWVGRAGFAELAEFSAADPPKGICYALLCEPSQTQMQTQSQTLTKSLPGHDAAISSKSLTGQAILDLSAGMWSIRTVDFRDGKTKALETARGRPVVCGLFSSGGPAVLFFRRISD